jgi:RNA polymerase sigma-70 factor (ECF subfamily)
VTAAARSAGRGPTFEAASGDSVQADVAAAPHQAAGSPAADATDLDLVRLAQSGDADAFGQLVERNRRAVFRAALAAVGSATEADDVAQEAFVTAWRKLAGFRGESQFRTWLLSITWRKAIDRRKVVTRWLMYDLVERVPSRERSQEDVVASTELHRDVRKLIRTLPVKLRDALLLAGSGEHTYDDISRMLDAPVGTVKWRVAEARRVLKRKLAAMGYSDD